MRHRSFNLIPWLLAGAALMMCCPPGTAAVPAVTMRLRNPFFDMVLHRNGSVTRLRTDPAGTGNIKATEFARSLRPENWEAVTETRLAGTASRATLGPLRVWQPLPLVVADPAKTTRADKLLPGQTLAQSFRVPQGAVLDAATVRIPTWNTKTSGAKLRLFHGTRLLAERRITNAVDNTWQEIRPPTAQGPGRYRVEIAEPVGEIGWWTRPGDAYPEGQALRNGVPETADRALRVAARQAVGNGTLRFSLDGATLTIDTELTPTAAAPASPHPRDALPWRWQTTWTRRGYDCTPRSGVVFSRFFSDNQRYMAAAQLKRRDHGGLTFTGARWIEMEGNESADLRLEGDRLALHWEMTEDSLSLRLDTAQNREEGTGALRSRLRVTTRARTDSVPAAYPRFSFADRRLTEDTNRFWWERAFSYPSPALPAAWFEWMAITRCWVGGPARDGEMRQLETYPMTPEGYVHTWRQDVGWPLRPKPTTDTRHSDTNARFVLACWRYWRWSGDDAFLRRQADRLRRAMRYQLRNLRGAEGLIVTESKDIRGRHRDQGNNYWDILPFGHLDAYANAVFYGSLQAMEEMETALRGDGAPSPGTDYGALREKARERFNAVFWDAAKGRYIGCVDVDGKRHDYGFTFVNIEALYYGLGDAEKARRVYRWMETEPTSSGKADTYTRFVFAPRATTLHNPMWRPDAPPAELRSPTPPWWVSWWGGTPYEEQCQDGGAILYVSYFDLMVRLRYFGAENAWKRWQEILGRYRLPDRLSGGAPLYTGEKPQQEDAGQVGVDYPFPESGMVPCFLLYGILGLDATPAGLQITPRLPQALKRAEARNVVWHGATLTVRVTPKTVELRGRKRDGSVLSKSAALSATGSVLIPAAEVTAR